MLLGDETHITYHRWRYRGEEKKFHSEEEGQPEVVEEEDTGDRNETPKDSSMHMLNYFFWGHQQIMQLMTPLVSNTEAN